MRQERFSAAARLATHLLHLACGQGPPRIEQAKWSEAGGETHDNEASHDELSWLPLPPTVIGAPGAPLPLQGAICAPAVVVELLVLLAEVQVSLGHPAKALRLCKWARHYAKEADIVNGVAFADASILASQLLAECPGLLVLAQIDDGKVNTCWGGTPEIVVRTDASERDAEARWDLITILAKETLYQAGGQRRSPPDQAGNTTLKADIADWTHRVTQSLSATPIMEKDNQSKKSNGHNLVEAQEQLAMGMRLPSALPVLHHLTWGDKEEACAGSPECNGNRQSCANLYDPWAQRRVGVLLDLAEALQHQTGKTAEYHNLVTLAGEGLRTLGEPSPPLCVRVWLHQLRGFRLQLEGQLALSGSTFLPLFVGSSDEDQQARALDRLMAEQLLRYFRVVMQVSTFVETYCANDMHLQKALFSEAVLLSVQILISSTQVLPQRALSLAASPLSEQSYGPDLLKKAALEGAQLCMLALCQMEQQRQQTTCFGGVSDLDTSLDSYRCHKQLIRLFAALHNSYMGDRSIEEPINEGKPSHYSPRSLSSY